MYYNINIIFLLEQHFNNSIFIIIIHVLHVSILYSNDTHVKVS